MSTPSTATDEQAQVLRAARSASPTKQVSAALGRYKLEAPNSDPEALAAWFELLGLLMRIRRSESKDSLGHAYAEAFLSQQLRFLAAALATVAPTDIVAVFRALIGRLEGMRVRKTYDLRPTDPLRWLENQGASAAAACIAVTPPPEVQIEGRLGTKSAQKTVFQATWTASGRPQEIVLKEFRGDVAKVIPREMLAYPLSMMHPNIIQTYRLENPADPERPFLAERRIHPLADDWRVEGLADAALVLTDIARALAFLAEQHLVHGDIKPDNIGYDSGRYLLLDFGVAQRASVFAKQSEATGTVLSRAPEVILGDAPQSRASDVFALGASVFNSLYGRFPLIDAGDERGEPHTPEREAFLGLLQARIATEWDQRLAPLDGCRHEGLRRLLRDMLSSDPSERPRADQVLRRALKELPALIGTPDGPIFRPSRELTQMKAFLSDKPEDMRLIPSRKVMDLKDRVSVLAQGVAHEEMDEVLNDLIADTESMIDNQNLGTESLQSSRAALIELKRLQASTSGDDVYGRIATDLHTRLDRHEEPWPETLPDGRALHTQLTISEVESIAHGYSIRLLMLIEDLERRQALAAW
jgi:serine/threonine protein kinase